MILSNLRTAILTILLLAQFSFADTNTKSDPISEEQIIRATWSMYVWNILGWQYDAPFWSKGSEETGLIGQKGKVDRDKNVRAVCLGEEGNFYVFFTLRSFVDPAFPNLFIQNVKDMPLNPDGKAFSESAIRKQSYLRYGGLSLVFYEDMGGGTVKIEAKARGVTHFDPENPKSHGRGRISRHFPGFYETIDNVNYERPHKNLSAREHLNLQKELRITFKLVDDHDVALLYVPKSAFTNGVIRTLGIDNPTLSVRLMLEHNRELFGFKFVLIGQETLDSIKNYSPNEDTANFTGFQKLLTVVAGLALSRETLQMVKSVDRALDRAIPDRISDRIADAKNRLEAGKVAWECMDTLIMTVLEDENTLAEIRKYLMAHI